MKNKIKIIYLIGFPRSGTTLVGELLNLLPDNFHIGETLNMWGVQKQKNVLQRKCSCGKLFSKCDYWAPILTELLEEVQNGEDFSAVEIEYFEHIKKFLRHRKL